MIDLYDNDNGKLIGSITDGELRTLVDALEEESSADRDYYINAPTIELLGDGRATDHLLQLLRGALGTREGIEVRWQQR